MSAVIPSSPMSLVLRSASQLATWGQVPGALAAGRMAALAVAVAMGGCAALPSQVERPVSHARTDVADTQLARLAATSTPAGVDARSGFRLLADGKEAFDARLALIGRSEKTIDVQYYLIASDATGLEFLGALRDAGSRGVRVRILVDDLYAAGQDGLFAALAAHANVEVRMFNPLPARTGGFARRIAFSLHEFSRINHRMHNKLFIADGTFAVTGGRNIADAYFDRGGESNFIDMDVLSAGPVVRELAAVFDRFWNSEIVYPIASLVRDAGSAGSPALPAATAAPSVAAAGIDAELSAGRLQLEPAVADVLADSPLKLLAAPGLAAVAEAHLALLRSARRDVLLASPYFVPGRAGVEALSQMLARDVNVSVLTNSLATTDEPIVHFGYARYRLALLKAGVKLHELVPSVGDGAEPRSHGAGSGRGGSLGRLHSKLAVVDEQQTFIGSMNMDPRSGRINTETGLVIHSAVLAGRVAAFLRDHQRDGSYRLQLDGPTERLTWLRGEGTGQRSRAVEPAAASTPGVGVRLMVQLLGEGML